MYNHSNISEDILWETSTDIKSGPTCVDHSTSWFLLWKLLGLTFLSTSKTVCAPVPAVSGWHGHQHTWLSVRRSGHDRVQPAAFFAQEALCTLYSTIESAMLIGYSVNNVPWTCAVGQVWNADLVLRDAHWPLFCLQFVDNQDVSLVAAVWSHPTRSMVVSLCGRPG